jgi:hypothetical protein
MASSGMLRRVPLVRTDVSERNLAPPSSGWQESVNLGTTLIKEALSYSETSVLTRGKRRNIPEDAILHKGQYFQLHCVRGGWGTHNTCGPTAIHAHPIVLITVSRLD